MALKNFKDLLQGIRKRPTLYLSKYSISDERKALDKLFELFEQYLEQKNNPEFDMEGDR
ncbi:MAG: hypothetical protein QNJ37_21555 [Crocosphaera sp.]|nr:hypothetical protein [Crocosphaera sp.]